MTSFKEFFHKFDDRRLDQIEYSIAKIAWNAALEEAANIFIQLTGCKCVDRYDDACEDYRDAILQLKED